MSEDHMQGIERKIEQGELDKYKVVALDFLNKEAIKIKNELDSGLSPSNYNTRNDYLKALSISVEILRNYVPSNTSNDDFINDLLYEFDDNLNWVLCQLGSYALYGNKVSQSILIYEGLVAVNESDLTIKESLAVAYIFAGKFKDAVSIYREYILISDSHNYAAKAFLGIALWQLGEKGESKNLLRDAYENGDDTSKQISGSYLASLDKKFSFFHDKKLFR